MRFFFIVVFVFCTSTAFGQLSTYEPTSKTSIKPTYPEKKSQKQKRLLALIKTDPRNTLIGNRCMEEVTTKMGFEYVLQPRGQAGNRNEFGRNVHNFGVKVALLFKNGPFWKFELKKKRNECKAKTGDYVG